MLLGTCSFLVPGSFVRMTGGQHCLLSHWSCHHLRSGHARSERLATSHHLEPGKVSREEAWPHGPLWQIRNDQQRHHRSVTKKRAQLASLLNHRGTSPEGHLVRRDYCLHDSLLFRHGQVD